MRCQKLTWFLTTTYGPWLSWCPCFLTPIPNFNLDEKKQTVEILETVAEMGIIMPGVYWESILQDFQLDCVKTVMATEPCCPPGMENPGPTSLVKRGNLDLHILVFLPYVQCFFTVFSTGGSHDKCEILPLLLPEIVVGSVLEDHHSRWSSLHQKCVPMSLWGPWVKTATPDDGLQVHWERMRRRQTFIYIIITTLVNRRNKLNFTNNQHVL